MSYPVKAKRPWQAQGSRVKELSGQKMLCRICPLIAQQMGVCFTLDWTWSLILVSVVFFEIKPDFHVTFYKGPNFTSLQVFLWSFWDCSILHSPNSSWTPTVSTAFHSILGITDMNTIDLFCPPWAYIANPSPSTSLIAQLVKNPPAMQEILVRFLGWEDLLEKG